MIEEYYKKNKSSMLKRVYKRSGSLHNAEDIVQNTFLMALSYGHTLRDKSLFPSWITKILENELRKFVRLEDKRGVVVSKTKELPPEYDDGKYADRQELLRSIVKEDSQQEILTLHYESGYGSGEIAVILNKSDEAVRKVITRFRHKLDKGQFV